MKKPVLLVFQLLVVVSLFAYPIPSAGAQAAVPGLVAAYGFEEGSGTSLLDQSGNSNHGTLTNGPTWVTTGKYGKAVQFDGNNDLITVPDSNSLDLTTGMTLEAWIYPTSVLSGWDSVIMKEQSTGLAYALYANGNGNIPSAYITGGGLERGAGGGSTLLINTWSHLAATFDGSVIRLYVNGNQVATSAYTGTIQTSTGGMLIGGSLFWSDEDFPGLIDEVRIYNRALSTSEIASDMQTPVALNIATASASPTGSFTSTVTSLAATSTSIYTATVTRTPTMNPQPSSTPAPSQTPTPPSFPTPSPGAYAFPIKPSPNGRYFVDQNNRPFFINGDAAWSLIGQVSREDAEYYMQDAVSKGINSIIVTLAEGRYVSNPPANYYGIQPFTTPGKFTTPNEDYFAHADWVINKAAQYGLQVILSPNYLGCCNDGWWDELMNLNTVSDAAWFGTYVGTRYKNVPNLMYAWGGDTNPCGYNDTTSNCSQRDKIRAMAQAAYAADSNHLHTFHATPEFSAFDIFNPSADPWLTTNVTYTYQSVQIKSLQDYNRNPVSPFFLFESHYEYEWTGRVAVDTRRQAYVAVLSGAAGHQYGNNPIWHFNGRPDGTTSWKLHLNDEGRADLPHIRALFESRAWYNLVPDQNHTAVISGFGSATGDDYVGAARTLDGSTVIAYIPFQKQITVDMTKISGTTVKAWWFNPRNGTSQLISTYPASGTQNFTPTTNEDWVLVLDNNSLNLSAPGSAPLPPPTTVPSNSQTPTATASPISFDGYSRLLLHMDGSDAATTFADLTGKPWTAFGNAQLDTAQSKFGGASALFDGNGDYLLTPDSADWDTGTGAFTVDFWVRWNSVSNAGLFTHGLTDDNRNMIYYEAGKIGWVYIGNGSLKAAYTFNFTPAAGTWYHFALVRNGTSVLMFINGVSQPLTINTPVASNNLTGIQDTYNIGVGRFNGLNNFFNGWIDEFHFSNGIARWTGNFVPPTSPYSSGTVPTSTPVFTPTMTNTPAVTPTKTNTPVAATPTFTIMPTKTNTPVFTPTKTNTAVSTSTSTSVPVNTATTTATSTVDNYTKVLLHMDGSDASTAFADLTGKPWTAFGNAQLDTAQSKFGGASALFDGNGDYLLTPDSADWDTGTGAFTVDFWVRWNSVSNAGLFTHGLTDNNRNMVYYEAGKIGWVYIGNGSLRAAYTINFTPTPNTWYHIALIRNGSTVLFFVNGISQTATAAIPVGTQTLSGIQESLHLGVGRFNSTNNHLNGWIDEFRFSNGIARWTGNFVPPTSPY